MGAHGYERRAKIWTAGFAVFVSLGRRAAAMAFLATLALVAIAGPVTVPAVAGAASPAWITGRAMDGCGGDSDDGGRTVEPCFSQWLSGVAVTLEHEGQVVATTSTGGQGEFSVEAPEAGMYEVIGGGGCGEQPEVQVSVAQGQTAGPITLFYPNDGEDSPYETCPASKTPPAIDSESVSNVSSTDATLEAQVNPHEASSGVYYQFQLVADASEYASEILCPAKLPPSSDGCQGTESASALPIGFIPGETLQPGVDRAASLDLASAGVTLEPGTTYHYRVLLARRVESEDTIEWEPPAIFGPDRTFTTQASTVGPIGVTGPSPTSGEDQQGTASTPGGLGGISSFSSANVNAPDPQAGRTTKLGPMATAQMLGKALKACAKKPRSERAACRKQARRRYGTAARKARKRSTTK